jgi:predicted ATPase/DNA-binding CsgD family transcriptional regulator
MLSPQNLPLQLTSFLGRDREMAEIKRLLTTSRLLTLTGAGGSGKTRLALQVASQIASQHLGQFKNGVFFVNLAPLTDPNLVAATIAQTLGLREAPGQPLLVTLKAYLQDKEVLLLLDNFEQVLQAAPQVVELLKAVPDLKVLVTSREPLHLHGEQLYRVPPLALPPLALPPNAEYDSGPRQPQLNVPPSQVSPPVSDVEYLAQYEAVALFIDRAKAARSDFALTEENARLVAQICHRLDGLPLAIELAAARVRHLSVADILERLVHRLQLLKGGASDLPSRQQTLRATIEWSYDLLAEGEKQLFRRMAVFQGGRSLKALEEVCNAEGLQKVDVLEGVAALVDKNLLQPQEGRTAESARQARFVMLETIHEYAREKLQESGEAGEIQRQHARYFVQLVEEAEPELRGPEQVVWFDRLEEEQDNIQAVFDWCRGEESGAEGAQIDLRLVGAMSWYWYTRGPFSEGRARARAVLARPEAQERTTWRVRALRTAVILAWIQGDFAAVRALAEEGLPLARELGDRLMEANFLNNLAHIALEGAEGDLAAARALYEQCLAIQRELGNRSSTAVALNNLALVDRAEGDLAAARPRIEEALAITRELGDTAGIAYSLQRLGELVYREGNYPLARALLEQALAIRREMGEQLKLPEILDSLGHAALREGDYDTAAACFRESLTFGTELGTRRYTWVWVAGLAVLAGAQRAEAGAGELGLRQAAKLFGASEGLREAAGVKLDPPLRAELDRDIAAIRAQLDEEAWQNAWEEGRSMSMEQAIAEALQSLEQDLRAGTAGTLEESGSEETGHTYPDDLTRREVQVLRLIATGKSNQEIAQELVLSLRTVERHISNIYQKIGSTGKVARATATGYAHRHGLTK